MRDDAPLSVDDLLYGYRRGLFPMADDDGRIDWYTVDPRAVIPLDGFHRSRRLARTCRNAGFEIRIDTSFTAVMQACAASAPDRPSTWIAPSMITSYTALHQAGFAHSVEAWRGDVLVGGLYGVALGRAFFGESMFARQTDASKIALAHLVRFLASHDFGVIDCQMNTAHLASLGAREIPRADFSRLLDQLAEQPGLPGKWSLEAAS